jgi:RimJ/RimL family protein N-acetyltransferase
LELSAAWLALVEGATEADPWIHGFTISRRDDSARVGECGFKGPPDAEGMVEIAYGIDPEQQGRGYATEAAATLVAYAFSQPAVRLVRAHTLPEVSASTRVLTKCGFKHIGEVVDPEDGLVWRWERVR